MTRRAEFIAYRPKTILNKGKRADHWFWTRYSAYPYKGCMHGCEFWHCRSAKSNAAHLTRLCCGLQYDGDPAIYAAIQKWLNGKAQLEKPEMLSRRGTLTVAVVLKARDGGEHKKRVRAWAQNVWVPYATQHALARTWLRAAIER